MADFDTFVKSLESEKNKGLVFENFCKWFLQHDPYWKTQTQKVWLWDEWPERWGPDCGIDLIFEHKNGDIWAVQAKCYHPDYSIKKADLDSFLAESSRSLIQQRLLLASTNGFGTNAQRACSGQEKPVILYLLRDFKNAKIEYPKDVLGLNQPKVQTKPTPDPHQIDAINQVVNGFKNEDRGQLLMACGTGKTLTTLWIKEALKAETTLYLVPSLNLLSQTLKEWVFAAESSFDVLCICSDKTVISHNKEDVRVTELPFAVTSDVYEINDFLSSSKQKVIFSTYQSSSLISEVQNKYKANAVDLVIADEAHRCAGKLNTEFSRVLDDKLIRGSKKLFTTATPRIYADNVKSKASEQSLEFVSMDDEKAFGPILHSLSFSKAINQNLLSDYQVVIVGVDHPMIKNWIDQRALIAIDENSLIDARTLAAKIGLLKAIKDYDLKRVITFHNRVGAAKDFSFTLSDAIELMEPDNRPKGHIWSSFVSGAMPTSARIRELEKLKILKNSDRGILANARCLSEGVDVPTLDGIAFIDPKSSQIDIIQAVGRAIRKVRGQKSQSKGTIVIPVFIEAGEDINNQIETSNFKPVWDILKALQAHDELLTNKFEEFRTALGAQEASFQKAFSEKVTYDIPISVGSDFSKALTTVLVQKCTSNWFFWYGMVKLFVKSHGHTRIPRNYKDSGYSVGEWLSRQRRNRYQLSKERVQKLEALKYWVWDDRTLNWHEAFDKVKQFCEEKGHINVHRNYSLAGLSLLDWITEQRRNREELSSTQSTMLESLTGWYWDPMQRRIDPVTMAEKQKEKEWNYFYKQALIFEKKNGSLRKLVGLKKSYRQHASGKDLYDWLKKQDELYHYLPMPHTHAEKLQALKFWPLPQFKSVSAIQNKSWNKNFAKVRNIWTSDYGGENLNRDVYRISWVAVQQQEYWEGNLTEYKIELLEGLENWIWSNPVGVGTNEMNAPINSIVENKITTFPINDFKEPENTANGHKASTSLNGYCMDDEVWQIYYEKVQDLYHLKAIRDQLEARQYKRLITLETAEPILDWCYEQRKRYIQGGLPVEKINLLEKIKGWIWSE